MTEKDLNERLNKIAKDRTLLDTIVYQDYQSHTGRLSEKQVQMVKSLFKLFDELRWEIALSNYKKIKVTENRPLNKKGCGTPVLVRPCKGDKTYFGILLGDIALTIQTCIDAEGTLKPDFAYYNPAIFIPDLKDIVLGMESWWEEITSENVLKNVITGSDINNCWYMKLLAQKI